MVNIVRTGSANKAKWVLSPFVTELVSLWQQLQ